MRQVPPKVAVPASALGAGSPVPYCAAMVSRPEPTVELLSRRAYQPRHMASTASTTRFAATPSTIRPVPRFASVKNPARVDFHTGAPRHGNLGDEHRP